MDRDVKLEKNVILLQKKNLEEKEWRELIWSLIEVEDSLVNKNIHDVQLIGRVKYRPFPQKPDPPKNVV